MSIAIKEDTNCLVLRMRSVNAIDATAMHNFEALLSTCQKKNVQLILSHVNEQPMQVMQKSGFYETVGAKNFCEHIDAALKRAEELA